MTDMHAPTMLPPAQQRRGALVMLIITFLMWTGFFMVIPLISIRYVDGLGWSAGAVGLVLAIRQLTQQGLTVFGGALADRFGAKELIVVGMLIRAISFSALAIATTYPFLMVSAILAAVGGALFELAIIGGNGGADTSRGASSLLCCVGRRARTGHVARSAGGCGAVTGRFRPCCARCWRVLLCCVRDDIPAAATGAGRYRTH
ncbi:MAG: MFS transporter [Roseiflexaceae bacterium]|nr:MFS transporter [Roseiflexaceae bacterium]